MWQLGVPALWLGNWAWLCGHVAKHAGNVVVQPCVAGCWLCSYAAVHAGRAAVRAGCWPQQCMRAVGRVTVPGGWLLVVQLCMPNCLFAGRPAVHVGC